jgi:hypothetical protein
MARVENLEIIESAAEITKRRPEFDRFVNMGLSDHNGLVFRRRILNKNLLIMNFDELLQFVRRDMRISLAPC